MKSVIIWLDVDDVLLDFKNRHNRFLRKKYKVNIPDDYIPLNWDYTEVIEAPLTFKETMQALGNRWSQNQKALPGASKFVKTLKKHGYHIILITHIEGEQGPERIKNLIKNKIIFDEIYFTLGRHKSEFAKEIIKKFPKDFSHIFMDDKAGNVIDFIENVPQTTLGVSLDLPFNEQWLKKYKNKKLKLAKNYLDMYEIVYKFLKIKK